MVTSDSAVMTVYEKPRIDTQPVDVIACEQDTVMFFTDAGVTTNPVYQWEIWNGAAWIIPPPDIYSGVNTDTMYINGIHSVIDGLQIRLRLSGICAPEQISDTAMLTVNERPEVVGQPVDVTICDGDTTFFGVDAGVTTSPVYTWEYFDGTNWQTASGGFFAGETTDTLLLEGVPATWIGTPLRAIISNLCGPNDTSMVANLVINERPGIDNEPVDVTTCEGIAALFTVDAGVTTNPGYLWEYHAGVAWLPVTGVQYSGQGTNTLTIPNPISAMNGYAYRVVVSGYCDPFVVSDSVTLTVEENAEVILQPVNASICENGDTIFTVHAGVTTNPSYRWLYNDGSGWQPVPNDGVHAGLLTNTLVLNNVPWSQDNWQYQAEVSGDCGPAMMSDSAGLVVYKLPEIITQPGDTTTCELLNVSFTVDVGDTDAPFLQWEEDDRVTGWQPLSDGGNYIGTNATELKVYTVDSSMTGFRYRVRLTGECDPEVYSDSVTLTVQSAPDIWTQPEGVTICEDDNTSFSIFATGTGISYQWQVDTLNGFEDITDSNNGVYAGWDSNTLVLTGADRNYHFNKYRVRVEGTCVPMTLSNLVILLVQTPAEIETEPVQNTICEFENAVYSVNVTGQGLSYQWWESTDGGGNWSMLSDVGFYIGSTTPTLSIFNVERGYDGNMYRVIITGACGLPAQSVDVDLTVKTAPEILTQPVALTACENMPAGFALEAQGTNISYQWQVNDGGGFDTILVTDPLYNGAGTDSLTLLSAQLFQAGYSYRAIVSGDCPAPDISDMVIMLVNANPVINDEPEDDSICEDGSTVFSADISGVNLVYQWYVDRNDMNGFVVLTDTDGIHLGSSTDQITLTSVPVTMDGWDYRLDVTSACLPISTVEVTLTVWPNPTPNILGDLPNYPLICGGDLLTLDGNPSSGSGTWSLHQWTGDIGPLSAVNEQVVEFETLIKGQYSLAYKVTDDRGCVGSDVVTIENDRPTAQFVSDAVPSCGYIEVNFKNTSTADAVTFLWDFGDSTSSTQPDISHGFDNVDPTGMVAYYHVKLIASSINNCRDTAQSVVTIYPKVVATIDADTTEGCHPLDVTFLTQPGGASYHWDFGDGNGEEGGYLAHHLYENFSTAAVPYTVTLTTTSFYGCQDSETLVITVQPIPAPNFSAVPLVQTYPDATVTFTNNTIPGPWTYLWDFGDSLTSTEENPVHTYTDPGTYLVKFYVNNGSCIDSIGTSIVIHPRIPIADFDPPESGCTPLEIRFMNQSQWATTYLWDFGDGYVSTKEGPTHTFYDPAEVTIRLQATGPGGTDYASYTINVYETPNIAFNSAPDSVFVKDKPVSFFNLSAGATEYLWDFGDYYEDGQPAEGNFTDTKDPQHIYFTEGWKDVKLVGWNDQCIDSLIMQVVKVIPAGDIQFPTIFRPSMDGSLTGGWVDPNDPNLDPNVKNSIFFPGVNKQVDEYHLYVYSRWGDLIFQSHDINHGWDGYIKGTLASQGVYIWKVTLVYKNGSPDSMAGDITLIWKRPQ